MEPNLRTCAIDKNLFENSTFTKNGKCNIICGSERGKGLVKKRLKVRTVMGDMNFSDGVQIPNVFCCTSRESYHHCLDWLCASSFMIFHEVHFTLYWLPAIRVHVRAKIIGLLFSMNLRATMVTRS